MGKRENDIDTIEVNVSSDDPVLDLKAIREAKGLTLEELTSSTRVSPSNLKAIENQQFDKLPEPIYAKAFIDTYARALDIDSNEILSRYDKFLVNLAPDENRHKLLKKLAPKKSHTKFWIWLVIASCVIVCIGVFSFYQWSQDGGQKIQQLASVGEIKPAGGIKDTTVEVPSAPEKEAATIAENDLQDSSAEMAAPENEGIDTEGDGNEPEVQETDVVDSSDADTIQDTAPAIAEEVPSKEGGAQPVEEGPQQESTDQQEVTVQQPADDAVTDNEGSYILVIAASELTWIQIQRDAGAAAEIMLRPGEKITKRALEKFSLIIGNAAGVDISFQGKPLGLLGKHGEVVHLILPADI
ncbi:MAG TPA: DUF4115 domain-containing protein [Syntrophales bacterium]|nr:DUF4115 domain-containing protein [Syntrophales bacterium]HPQ42749.1 DUF4115 domain-containing protein [Syntrophales bacterium]